MTAIVSPPAVDALPPAPLPTDTPADFNAKGFATVAAQVNMVPQVNAVAANVFSNATAANERAVAADISATTANTEANLAMGYRNTAGNHALAVSGYANTAKDYRDQAGSSALAASGSAGAAAAAQAGAETARDQTLTMGAQVLTASSSTSMVPGTGAKSFNIETGRAFAQGMRLVITSAGDVSAQMTGSVTSYDRATGALQMLITASSGSAARADWVLGIAGGDSSDLPLVLITTNTTAQAGRCYVIGAAGITLTMPTTWATNDRIQWLEAIGNGAQYSVAFGATPVRGRVVGTVVLSARYGGSPGLRHQDPTRGLV